MKSYLTFIAIGWLLNLSVSVHAQSPFSKVFYDSLKYGIQANAILKTLDNGYLIAGYTVDSKGLTIKIDSAGNLSWNKTIDGGEDEIFKSVVAAPDSGFVLAGGTYDTTAKLNEALCVKINSKGDTIWSKTIRHIGWNNTALAVQQTNDSGYILTGYSTKLNFDSSGVFTAKLNAKGNLQWTNIVTLGNNANIGYSVSQTPDSGYVIIGYIENNPPFDPNAFLIKLTSAGEVTWAKKYHLASTAICSGTDLLVMNDGILCLVNTGNDISLMKTDFSGNILWNKSLGQSAVNQNCKLRKTYDNGYVFASGEELFKTDSAGNFLWEKSLFLVAVEAVEAPDKGLLILGNGPLEGLLRMASVPNSPQIGIIKTDSLGNGENCVYPNNNFPSVDTLFSSSVAFTSLPGGIARAIHPVVSSILLVSDTGCIGFFGGIQDINSDKEISIYPNPSPGRLKLMFTNRIIRGTVEIYNVVGEKIFEENIFNESKKEIDLESASSGIYIVKVTDGNKQSVQKLVIQ